MVDTFKSSWESLHKEGYNAFSHNIVFNALFKHNLIFFNPQDYVLDIGCGSGDLFEYIHPHIGKYTGIDISTNVCAKLVNRHFDNKKLSECKECSGDGIIPFEDGIFDKVLSCLVLQHVHIKHLRKYIEESSRVLKPNGMILFHTTTWKDSIHDNVFDSKDMSSETLKGYIYGGSYSHDINTMTQLFSNNGFETIKIDYFSNKDIGDQGAIWNLNIARKK